MSRQPRPLLILLACLAVCPSLAAEDGLGRDVIFQVSTLPALMEGVYDGETTMVDLLRFGDLGLGTFNALDGEMVVVDGAVFRVRADGVAYPVPDEAKTPFAAVTFFDEDIVLTLDEPLSLEALLARMDAALPGVNLPYAARIEGVFAHVKTRSVPAQERPYPRLADVVASQPTFEFSDVAGTIVGFRLPGYLQGVNVPGWHLHFITADRTAGGHLLALESASVRVALDISPGLHIALPLDDEFGLADLGGDRHEEVRQIEK